MSAEENKAAVYRLNDAVNNDNYDIFPQLFSSNFIYHVQPEIKGPDGVKVLKETMRSSFPDYHEIIDHLLAVDDLVAQFYTLTGTFTNELDGFAPTGKHLTWPICILSKFENGKQIEAWNYSDSLTMFLQLGIKPTLD